MNSRKKPSTTPNPSLPDDLLVSCFARVSRLHYPTFSLASNRFRSLLASPELYQTRSSLGHKESCLYVCLQFHPDPNTRWFTLCQKPNQTGKNHNRKKNNKKTSGYALAPIPITNFPQAYWTSVVSLGSNIYNIGSSIYKSPSSSVSILDCWTHTWREGPSMRVERYWSSANVFDGKIYVVGGCEDVNASNYMEVFDPNTQTWESVLCPLVKSGKCNSAVIEDEICVFGDKGFAAMGYKPKKDKWESIGMMRYFNTGWEVLSYCVIHNVLYCCNALQGIEWYNSKTRNWNQLKGLERLPKFDSYGLVKLVDYGGKMAVLWDKFVRDSGDKKICCAVITLERRNKKEIWGKVEWSDVVLTVPVSCELVCALAATV